MLLLACTGGLVALAIALLRTGDATLKELTRRDSLRPAHRVGTPVESFRIDSDWHLVNTSWGSIEPPAKESIDEAARARARKFGGLDVAVLRR